jgi:F-type H+-transporting ATPase subunit b
VGLGEQASCPFYERNEPIMRRIVIGLALIALAVLSAPVLASAEGASHSEESKILGVEGSLFVGALELSLWTIVVFLLLLFVLRKFAWGPILAGLQQREEGIARDKSEAEAARRLAAEAKVAAEKGMAQAAARASELITKARQDAEATVAEQLAKGKAELQAERTRLHHEMEMERKQAQKQLIDFVAQLATQVAGKAIGKQLTIADQHNLVNEALGEFAAAGKTRLEEVESARS